MLHLCSAAVRPAPAAPSRAAAAQHSARTCVAARASVAAAGSAAASPYAHLKVKELRRNLTAAGVDCTSILEKRDLEAAWGSLSEAQRQAVSPAAAVKSPVVAAAVAANVPLSPPPHAPGDPVAALCVDLGKSLSKRGLQSGSVLGSVMLYEMLLKNGLRPKLTQGFFIITDGGADGAVWHVWVTLEQRIYDAGREILLAGSSNSAQALAAAMAVKNVRYALAVPAGCVRVDLASDEARKLSEMNEKMWTLVNPDKLEETLWASAPDPVKKLNADVKAEFAGRKLKAPPPPRAQGFGGRK